VQFVYWTRYRMRLFRVDIRSVRRALKNKTRPATFVGV
jgi:hypothetical protein